MVVAHTTSISQSGAFVHTNHHCAVGTKLRVRLSFPRYVEPFELDATVTDIVVSGGFGEPHGMTVAFWDQSDRQLQALFARLEDTPVPKWDRQSSAGKVVNGSCDNGPVPKRDARSAFHVLLVDDSDIVRELFIASMRKHFRLPFIVDTAADCEQGWGLLRTYAYDLTVIDYFLPSVEGSRLVELVRARSETADLPVVAISVGGSRAREAFLAAGADIYLDKPIVMHDLLHTLGWLTRGGTPS